MSNEKLIDTFLLVGIRRKATATDVANAKQQSRFEPFIKQHFPETELSTAASRVPIFCFPDDVDEVASQPVHRTGIHFTFVFTEDTGNKQFGVCRRIPTNRGDSEECFCLLTHLPWFSFHYRLLEIIEERYFVGMDAVTDFLAAVMDTPVPDEPSFTIRLTPSSKKSSRLLLEYDFTLPADHSLSNAAFKVLFDALDLDSVITLFASILFERRILMVSKDLTKVSACVHSAIALLQPFFDWQSIYIPVLPLVLLDYCMAPMPFLMGLHTAALPAVRKMPIEQVLFVDLDRNTVTTPPDVDDLSLMPTHTYKLRQALQKVLADSQRTEVLDPLLVRDALLPWYMTIFGTMMQHVRRGPDGRRHLDKDEFIRTQPKSVRRFLEHFCASQMFERFAAECEERGRLRPDSSAGPSGSGSTALSRRESPASRRAALVDSAKDVATQAREVVGKAGEAVGEKWHEVKKRSLEKGQLYAGIAKELAKDRIASFRQQIAKGAADKMLIGDGEGSESLTAEGQLIDLDGPPVPRALFGVEPPDAAGSHPGHRRTASLGAPHSPARTTSGGRLLIHSETSNGNITRSDENSVASDFVDIEDDDSAMPRASGRGVRTGSAAPVVALDVEPRSAPVTPVGRGDLLDFFDTVPPRPASTTSDPGPQRPSEPFALPKNPFRALVPNIDYDAMLTPPRPAIAVAPTTTPQRVAADDVSSVTHGLTSFSVGPGLAHAHHHQPSFSLVPAAAAGTPGPSTPAAPASPRPVTPMFAAGTASSSKAAQALANIESSFLGTPLASSSSSSAAAASAPSTPGAAAGLGSRPPMMTTSMGAAAPRGPSTPMGGGGTPMGAVPRNYSALQAMSNGGAAPPGGFSNSPHPPPNSGALVNYWTPFASPANAGAFGAGSPAPPVVPAFGAPVAASASGTPGRPLGGSASNSQQLAASTPGVNPGNSSLNFDPFNFF